ncbi:hypothetical protein, partial [Microcystis aeruginosa]|uniref:hypothetical protein n=1 Tax=Microcystis aeruginosa TaxID=1126 RepID=UPI0011151E6F
MKVLISLMLFVLSYNQTYSQVPINYVLGEKSVSKDYILKGKSLLKIKNTSKIKSLIKSDLEFTNFYTKKKDSINEWYISSLILFSIKDKHIITPNKIISDFELNNIANNF